MSTAPAQLSRRPAGPTNQFSGVFNALTPLAQTSTHLSSLSSLDSSSRSRAASPVPPKSRRVSVSFARNPSSDAPPIFKQPPLPALNEHPDMPSNPSLTFPHAPIPITPSSSLGLPSPTFPPRKLPPRSPARPKTATNSAASSRRNSWQVSVRLASARAAQHAASNGVFPSFNEDILTQGDLIGEGVRLAGEIIQPVQVAASSSIRPFDSCQLPNAKFEVIRKLGTGSYAVVFLVREVFDEDGLSSRGNSLENLAFDDPELNSAPSPKRYGREFAIKCLSKANLSPQELQVQMLEATIHQSLRIHPNIVTLYRTLETSAFLLLVLEYVPGEDLFYFLEQSRDSSEDETDAFTDDGRHRLASPSIPPASNKFHNTPPTPSLLSSVHPSQLLSHGRLRLIASMFAQMCDAVQACHSQGVSHRDIKPENFIVTDGQVPRSDGTPGLQRRVIVKLSDFGLATTEAESSDMDCGSAPYMSYECRNNVGPTYATQPADIWSLGIVLINMLYHHNLWSDTSMEGDGTSSFELYRAQPIAFLMQRCPGLTADVANFLAQRVFRVIELGDDPDCRVTAVEFGEWAKRLPILLAQAPDSMSLSEAMGAAAVDVALSSPGLNLHTGGLGDDHSTFDDDDDDYVERVPRLTHSPDCQHHSSDEEADEDEVTSPRLPSSSAFPSVPSPPVGVVSTDNQTIGGGLCGACLDVEMQRVAESGDDAEYARTTSATKRRKRGARKGKGSASTSIPPTPSLPSSSPVSPYLAPKVLPPLPGSFMATDEIDRLEGLAQGTQVLAREISRVSKKASIPSLSRSSSVSANATFHRSIHPEAPMPIHGDLDVPKRPVVTKKPSMWNVFGRKDTTPAVTGTTLDKAAVSVDANAAANVTSIIMSLSSQHTPKHSSAPDRNTASTTSTASAESTESASAPWRGRRQEPRWGPSALPTSPDGSLKPGRSSERWVDRSPAPSTTYSARSTNWRQQGGSSGLASSASSMTSGSVYTRFSNGSERSLSTVATSVSASSMMTGGFMQQQQEKKRPQAPGPVKSAAPAARSVKQQRPPLPSNVKNMDGIPWELDQLPRFCHPRINGEHPTGDIFGKPPVRRRKGQPKPPPLDTINERPKPSSRLAGPPQLAASRSGASPAHDASGESDQDHTSPVEGQPKKVQKAQINALAKMLSTFKTKGRSNEVTI